MIDRAWAEDFAHDWAASWNARDVEAVLAHFSPDVVFRSPRIAVVHGAGACRLQDWRHCATIGRKRWPPFPTSISRC